MNMDSISVIGAGAWGTALAQMIAQKGLDVELWARSDTQVQDINSAHENKRHLPGISLDARIKATSNLKTALQSNIILMVTPAQALRGILSDMKPYISAKHMLVLCSKGIEAGSGALMSDVAQSVLPETPVAVLTGPNFAHDIALGKPAATTLACADETIAKILQNAIAGPHFRPYISNDVIGAQVAGALKNVIAIACGIAQGLEMGESARASLVTRGLAEIARLGCSMGARQETFMGLCGVGDMMLTCGSERSRNFSLGLMLGQGQTFEQIMAARYSVTEGAHTVKTAEGLAATYKTAMPICHAVHKCLYDAFPLDAAIDEMLNRPLGHE